MTGPQADLRVLFFGDSIVAGTGDPEARGWVGRVAAATRAAGIDLTAYPLGVRRQTSVEVAARWRAETLPRLHAGADCRVVFDSASTTRRSRMARGASSPRSP